MTSPAFSALEGLDFGPHDILVLTQVEGVYCINAKQFTSLFPFLITYMMNTASCTIFKSSSEYLCVCSFSTTLILNVGNVFRHS